MSLITINIVALLAKYPPWGPSTPLHNSPIYLREAGFKLKMKLYRVDPLITDPPPTSSTPLCKKKKLHVTYVTQEVLSIVSILQVPSSHCLEGVIF